MYCKNCGKDLPDDARFCDKCNMSVRKREGKLDMIEELKEERLARQKAHEIEARLKKIKKVKRKRYRAIAYGIIIIVLMGITAFLVSFSINDKNSMTNDKAEYRPQTTPAPPTPEPKEELCEAGIIENVSFLFPKDFYPLAECNGLVGYSDGKSVFVITKEEAVSSSQDLMRMYVDSIPNADPDEGKNRSYDDGYTITLTAGTWKHHKKCVIKDGYAYAYELQYPSEDSDKYAECITEMDENFTVS